MGYKYKHVNGRKILCEQKHVVASKITFLRKFLQYQNSNENITSVYLEDLDFSNESSVLKWVHDSEIKSNPSKIKSEGKRFTVLFCSPKNSKLPAGNKINRNVLIIKQHRRKTKDPRKNIPMAPWKQELHSSAVRYQCGC
uniref:Uncharacterized protein n=1 Tax=Photinus pyralis TaxID=7054 RepID=A0A1Y1NJX8_PHOPY